MHGNSADSQPFVAHWAYATVIDLDASLMQKHKVSLDLIHTSALHLTFRFARPLLRKLFPCGFDEESLQFFDGEQRREKLKNRLHVHLLAMCSKKM